jgi:hypothetical protein
MDPSACCVKADFVFSFQFPKLAFLFPENYVYVGEWEVGDIGLHPDMVHQIETPFYYVEEKDIQSMMKPRHKFSHKGHFGHALIIAGSKGMMGAAVLAAKACLRSGAGIVEMHIPNYTKVPVEITFRSGWKYFGFHASYMITKMFEPAKGPQMYPFSLGISLSLY